MPTTPGRRPVVARVIAGFKLLALTGGIFALIGTVVIVLIVGYFFVSIQPDYGKLRELQALPEASLPAFPGATLLGESSEPARPGIEGTSHAVIRRGFGAPTSRDAVVSYYDGLLTKLGWDDGGVPAAEQWLKGRFRFTLHDNVDTRYQFSWLDQLENAGGP